LFQGISYDSLALRDDLSNHLPGFSEKLERVWGKRVDSLDKAWQLWEKGLDQTSKSYIAQGAQSRSLEVLAVISLF
jgi:hypothetical protein